MKYLIRSVKYLLFILILFSLMIAIMMLTSPGENVTIEGLFVPGALPKIALFFVVIAAVYPMFGYVKKEAYLNKGYEQAKDKIENVFENIGYQVVSEDSEKVVYRSKKPLVRLMRVYEDHITVNKSNDTIILEGGRKDVYRIARAIEYAVNKEEE